MRVVDFINELSQHPGAAEVTALEYDADGVYVTVEKVKKPRKKKTDSDNGE